MTADSNERPIENSGQGDLAAFERSKMELEVLKLSAELAQMKSWSSRFQGYLPLLTALVAVVGLVIGGFQLLSELRRSNEARRAEFQKPFLERRLALYLDASEAAATIATSTDERQKTAALNRFWVLYAGPLSVVEDSAVESSMVEFGSCLRANDANCDLLNISLALAHDVRESIGRTWDVGVGELRGKYNK